MMQATVAIAAITLCLTAMRMVERQFRSSIYVWLLACTALALFLPLLSGGDTPHRWVGVGGFRLYIAAAVLPSALIFLGQLLSASPPHWLVALLAAISIATALALHPDAAQVTAFALAATVLLLWSSAVSWLKWGTLLLLVVCIFAAWSQPDALQPVTYVEGVISLAATKGALSGGASVLACVIPLLALAWLAKSRRSLALLAVAVYYFVIGVHAYLQLTPMPLLGFGAGPILGYFAMVFFAAKLPVASDPTSTN